VIVQSWTDRGAVDLLTRWNCWCTKQSTIHTTHCYWLLSATAWHWRSSHAVTGQSSAQWLMYDGAVATGQTQLVQPFFWHYFIHHVTQTSPQRTNRIAQKHPTSDYEGSAYTCAQGVSENVQRLTLNVVLGDNLTLLYEVFFIRRFVCIYDTLALYQ